LIGGTEDALNFYKAMRIPVLDPMPRWIAVLDREGCHALMGQTGEFWAKFKQVNAQPSQEVSLIERFDDAQEFFFEKTLGIQRFCRRTGKFLNWRFKDIPHHNYQFIRSADGRQYGVFRIEKIKGHDHAVTRIIEWAFDARHSPQALGLLCQASRVKRSILMDFFSTAPQPGRFLEGSGFVAEKEIGFVVPRLFRPIKQTDSGISFAMDRPQGPASQVMFADWHITNTDNDSERIKL
jgi:hypothetical protein